MKRLQVSSEVMEQMTLPTHFAHREMKAQPAVMHYMTHSMMPLCDIIQGNVTNLL